MVLSSKLITKCTFLCGWMGLEAWSGGNDFFKVTQRHDWYSGVTDFRERFSDISDKIRFLFIFSEIGVTWQFCTWEWEVFFFGALINHVHHKDDGFDGNMTSTTRVKDFKTRGLLMLQETFIDCWLSVAEH